MRVPRVLRMSLLRPRNELIRSSARDGLYTCCVVDHTHVLVSWLVHALVSTNVYMPLDVQFQVYQNRCLNGFCNM